jgi:hypothetical protein
VGDPGDIQDRSFAFDVPLGATRVLVKVFEGAGGWAFRLRFEDRFGAPLLSNRIGISFVPYGPCPEEVEVVSDSWLREVVFRWENRLSEVAVYETGALVAATNDFGATEVRVAGVTHGEHRYEFRSRIGDDKPPCDAIQCIVEMLPVWPADFACYFDTDSVFFSWRNGEPYYDVLKIQEDGADVIGVVYGENEARLPHPLEGFHVYTLVAGTAGYRNQGLVCAVDVPEAGDPIFRRGDVNADRNLDIGDPIDLLAYLFAGGPEPLCHDAADAGDEGSLDIGDAIGILGYLFSGELMPPPGGEDCGRDPTEDELPPCAYPPELCSP